MFIGGGDVGLCDDVDGCAAVQREGETRSSSADGDNRSFGAKADGVCGEPLLLGLQEEALLAEAKTWAEAPAVVAEGLVEFDAARDTVELADVRVRVAVAKVGADCDTRRGMSPGQAARQVMLDSRLDA